jgi:hypothetical protein
LLWRDVLVDWEQVVNPPTSYPLWHSIQKPIQVFVVHETVLCYVNTWEWDREQEQDWYPWHHFGNGKKRKHIVKKMTFRRVVLNGSREINKWSWRWRLGTVSKENINGRFNFRDVNRCKEFVSELNSNSETRWQQSETKTRQSKLHLVSLIISSDQYVFYKTFNNKTINS